MSDIFTEIHQPELTNKYNLCLITDHIKIELEVDSHKLDSWVSENIDTTVHYERILGDQTDIEQYSQVVDPSTYIELYMDDSEKVKCLKAMLADILQNNIDVK